MKNDITIKFCVVKKRDAFNEIKMTISTPGWNDRLGYSCHTHNETATTEDKIKLLRAYIGFGHTQKREDIHAACLSKLEELKIEICEVCLAKIKKHKLKRCDGCLAYFEELEIEAVDNNNN